MRYSLLQDKRGMLWDLALYVPTVFFLATIASKYWFEGNQNFAYLLSFLASFFFFAGSNRILKTRLLMLPSAPVSIEVSKSSASIHLKNGSTVDLIKQVKRYGDYAGKTFGLSGLDGSGRRQQFVFHKGQFEGPEQFKQVQDGLDRLHDITFA